LVKRSRATEKQAYFNGLLEKTMPRLRPGGLIVAHNINPAWPTRHL
jgi:hypothetical protein